MSWPKAESYAEKPGGHLVTITSEEEQSYVTSIVAENYSTYTGEYWIGASDVKKEGTWKWVTGEKFSYTNWASGEPNDYGGEDYLRIYNPSGLWDDYITTAEDPFILEWDALTVEENLLEFETGDTGYIHYTASGSGTVSFKSSDTSVAKVSSKGKVIAKGAGVCKITVKYKKDSLKVAVIVTPKKTNGLKKQSATAKMVQLNWKKQSGVPG